MLLAGLFSCTTTHTLPTRPSATAGRPTEIWLFASPHLGQLRKASTPLTDVFTPRRQKELAALHEQLLRFRPDAIMVEELPEQQVRIDSLYQRYRQGQLVLDSLPDGRSETFQLGFALGKRLGINRIYCVNSPGGTSQSILNQGTNVALYEQATAEHRQFYKPVMEQFENGTRTLSGLYSFLNSPSFLQQLHTLVYRTPARVTNGTLKPDPMVDAAFINPHYVGAEFISVIYNRDLKIYSNIVTTQLTTSSSRILTIIGGRHVASLQGIFATDPAYHVVKASAYLK